MDFSKYNIGFGITGSFCTFAKARKEVEHLCDMGANVIPDLAVRKSMWRESVRSPEMKASGRYRQRSRSDQITSSISWSLHPAPEIRRQSCATALPTRRS